MNDLKNCGYKLPSGARVYGTKEAIAEVKDLILPHLNEKPKRKSSAKKQTKQASEE